MDLTLDDFDRVGKRVPHLADMKPHGRYHMVDLDRIGGLPVVMQELLDAGLLHGGCLTVSGLTLAENLAAHAHRPRKAKSSTALRTHPCGWWVGHPPGLARPGGRRGQGGGPGFCPL